MGHMLANHYIITKYAGGENNIGYHFDKPNSIKEGSLITVVKTGTHGRLFQVRDRVFPTKRQAATINFQQKRAKDLRQRMKALTKEKNTTRCINKKFVLHARLKLCRESIARCKKAEDAVKAKQKRAQETTKPFFNEVVEPGAAIIMTLEANLLTQHAVPKMEGAGPSGSIVFRTIAEVVPASLGRRRVT